MSLEVVHAPTAFRQPLGLRVLERQCQFHPCGPLVAAAAEPGSELSGVDPVTAANTHLGQARAGFFEKDGELLVAERVELVDRAVRLVSGGAAVPQAGLADRSPNEAVPKLVVQTLQDAPLHAERRGRPALEEAACDHDGVGTQLNELGGGTERVRRG